MKALKSLFIVLFAFIILVTCCVCVSADDGIDVDEAYTFATDFLTEYYYAANLLEDCDFTQYVDSLSLLEFVNGKTVRWQSISLLYGKDYIDDYSIEYTLKDSTVIDSCLKLSIKVVETLQYKGANVETIRGETCQIIVGVAADSYVIMDWYTGLDGYDRDIRGGENLSIADPYFWSDEAKSASTSALIQAQMQWAIDFNTNVINDSFIKSSTEEEEMPHELTATRYSLNKTAMVSWALENCIKQYPDSGNYSLIPEYRDFSQIGQLGKNWDCTNFVSHAILAGGAPMKTPTDDGEVSPYWYYNDDGDRSSSWSSVDKLSIPC